MPSSSKPAEPSRVQHALLAWLLVTVWLLPLVGCQGCWSSNPSAKNLTAEEELEEKEKKKKKLAEKPKPDFEIPSTIILPNETGQDIDDDGTEKKPSAPKVVFYTKPGHWVAASQLAKANNFDFQGELHTFAMDQSELPLDVEHTDFRLSFNRPATLPKGRQMRFETMFFLPKRGSLLSRSYSLRTELRATRSSRLPEMINVAGNSLREHEYYLVVLARNPSSYIDLAKLDSVQLQGSDLGSFQGPFEQQAVSRFYHAVFPRTDKSVPLPKHPLAWTMIAYIVWDDLDPNVLTAEQQTALLDWLHWGGQLIISGPNSLDRLKQTFLEPYLPATSGKALTINNERLQTLNEKWSVRSTQPLKKPANIVVPADKPLVGVELVKHVDAEWLPNTGELVLERRVGQGRIVVSSFALSAVQYRFWASRDNFFNACLLRRPARSFELLGGTDLTMRWTGSMSGVTADDPRLATRLRFFTRDIGRMRQTNAKSTPQATLSSIPSLPGLGPQTEEPKLEQPAETPSIAIDTAANLSAELQPVFTAPGNIEDHRFAGYEKDQLSGVAGWNDFSGAADASLAALNDASGIKIPRADFVLKVLIAYLVVLVPLNWLIFWLIGRVEYAWLAAPVVAIIGAISVVRLAQLDIGFARSRTEIAVLESHAGYPRAHVTRFTALYTSLSTSYDLRFDDPDALALPYAQTESYQRRPTRPASDVALTQDKTIELSDVQVQSNSTGKVHVEQMLSLKAPFLVTGDETRGWQLENGSQFTLRQAGILRRRADNRVEAAYFPDIEPGGIVRLNFQPVNKEKDSWVPQWDKSPMMSHVPPTEDENRVRLYRLSQLAARQLQLLKGDMRLIAWTDDAIPGLRIIPSSVQSTTYTLVLVHLKTGAFPAPEPDPRLRTDVLQDEVKSEDEKETGGK